MENSRRIWEESSQPHHDMPEKFRKLCSSLFMTGLIGARQKSTDIGEGESADSEIYVKPEANQEVMDVVRQFCDTHRETLEDIARDIPDGDSERYVVEMTRRLRIVELNEQSDFASGVSDIRKLITKDSSSVLLKSAISFIALYVDHIKKANQDNVVSMEEFREKARHAVG